MDDLRGDCPYPPDVRAGIGNCRIGVIGLGGIGSHVTQGLARAGVRRFVLADFDVLEGSNLYRQSYDPGMVGMGKTEASVNMMGRIDSPLEIKAHDVRVTAENVAGLFGGCDVVVEAVDDPSSKAELVEAMLSIPRFPPVVSCSGMAGIGDSNSIVVRHPMRGLYLVGDGVSEADGEGGLFEGRVMVCAGHMVNTVLRLVLGLDKP